MTRTGRHAPRWAGPHIHPDNVGRLLHMCDEHRHKHHSAETNMSTASQGNP